ncbi:uncharacterized protein LTR77_008960 [Saxophila tyrrhenica]|uniref:Uncharacterized protein n=1 Tax=Saxophila tyrrhenica TaxID=1690608 RepID=A0AAV9NZ52_9PEZI|nr:hypothetical protein LTR77_008960 [Saxophila tyrrhenica]
MAGRSGGEKKEEEAPASPSDGPDADGPDAEAPDAEAPGPESPDLSYYMQPEEDEDEQPQVPAVVDADEEAQASPDHPNEEGSLDTADTWSVKSAFSDSSSSDEEDAGEEQSGEDQSAVQTPAGETEDAEDDPFADFDSTTTPQIGQQPFDELYDDDDNYDPQTPESALLRAAAQRSPESLHSGALLPFKGLGYDDPAGGAVLRRDVGHLRRGRSTAAPSGDRREVEANKRRNGMPSRLAAEGSDRLAAERYRMELGILREDFKEAEEMANRAQRYRDERNGAAENHAWARSELQRAFDKASELKGQLERYKVEAESWEKAFKKQQPLAMVEKERRKRKEEGVEESRGCGTQTQHPADLSLRGVADAETQTQSPEDLTSIRQVVDAVARARMLLDVPFVLLGLARLEVAEHIARWLDMYGQQTVPASDFVELVEQIETLLATDELTVGSFIDSLKEAGFSFDTNNLAHTIETCLRQVGGVPVGISLEADAVERLNQVYAELAEENNLPQSQVEEMKEELRQVTQWCTEMSIRLAEGELKSEDKSPQQESSRPTTTSLEDLEGLIEHGRALAAECHRLEETISSLQHQNSDLQRSNDRLRAQAAEQDAALATADRKRRKLNSEKAKVDEKYTRIRQWIVDSSTNSELPLPSPCTPLPLNRKRRRGAPSSPQQRSSSEESAASGDWERKRVEELKNGRSMAVSTRTRRWDGNRSFQPTVNVDVKVEFKEAEPKAKVLEVKETDDSMGYFWRVMIVVLLFLAFAQLAGSSSRDWQRRYG